MTQQQTGWSMVEPIGRVPFQARMNPKLKDDIYDMARIEGKHIYEITEDAFRHYLKDGDRLLDQYRRIKKLSGGLEK